MELDFISEEQIKEKESKMTKSLNVLKITNAFLHWLEEHKGHEKIDEKEIVELAMKFLDLRKVEHSLAIIDNFDGSPMEISDDSDSEEHKDRVLVLNIKDYYGTYDCIGIFSNYHGEEKGGYYDNLFEINFWAKDENVLRTEISMKNRIDLMYENYVEYNKCLSETIRLKSRMGF